jgi:acyl dehydratase
MANGERSLAWLREQVGQELGISDWFTVDQALINAFAVATFDDQWIHLDVERAQRESLYGTTIAHGFLTLSLTTYMRRDIDYIPDGVSQVINYGADKLRFLSPVPAGSRIRLRVHLISLEERGEGRLLLKSRNTVEIEGQETPALVVDQLALLIFSQPQG